MPRARLTSLATAVESDVPLRAFIYDRNSRVIDGRVRSTQDQSIENQRTCDANGWVISGEFCDPGRSASRYARRIREDYERMLTGIEAGECDVLVIWEASRGYRSTETYLQLRNLLEKRGVLLCYNGRLYDMRHRGDRFITGFDALRAEEEADGTRERNLRTARLSAERGGVWGPAGYGFRRIYDEETRKLVRQYPDEERAPIVREATRRVAAGQHLRAIAADFEERGLPQPRSGWSASSVKNIVLRPANVGLREHNGVIVGDGVWEPILETEDQVATYYAAVRLLEDPSRRTSHDTAAQWLMSGVALCSLCPRGQDGSGQRLWAARPGKGGKRCYVCKVCGRVSVNQELFDDVVQGSVVAYVERPAFAASLIAKRGAGVGEALAQASALEKQLADARTAAATWDPAAKRMRLPVQSLLELEGALVPQIEAARARAMGAAVPPTLRRLAGPDARTRWDELDLLERKGAIRDLVRVWLNPAGKGARTIKPERITWDWIR